MDFNYSDGKKSAKLIIMLKWVSGEEISTKIDNNCINIHSISISLS